MSFCTFLDILLVTMLILALVGACAILERLTRPDPPSRHGEDAVDAAFESNWRDQWLWNEK